jgi:2-methylisocitrate lyase-like PEP mutase family enzyme
VNTPRTELKEKSATLLALHTRGDLQVLPNVWNPIGARILQAKGYPAVATASSAAAASLGYEDEERLSRSTVIDAGIVGVNIEDGIEEGGALRSIEDQCARISAARQIAARRGLHLVINARIDSYLSSSFAKVDDATEDAVSRASAYANSGADCVYPIGPGEAETVKTLRARIASPINILGMPWAAPLSVLSSIGVNRVSLGPFVFRACLRKFVDIAEALMNQGDYDEIEGMLSRAEAREYLLDEPE